MPLRTCEAVTKPIVDCEDVACKICYHHDHSTDYDLPDDELTQNQDDERSFIR